MSTHDPLDRLFRPRSIAVIGASANAAKIGGIPVALLRQMGYAGAIHPVNPGAKEVQGLRCHAHVDDIDEPVDVAIIALPMAAGDTLEAIDVNPFIVHAQGAVAADAVVIGRAA